MKYLVTGGKGFIGSHIVEELLKDQTNKIIVIDNESSECNEEFYEFDSENVEYYNLDIFQDEIEYLFEGVSVVFHLAADSRIQPSLSDPIGAFETNTIGTLRVLESCKKHGVERVVYSASSSYYGLKNVCPLKENMPCDCLNPYSLSKYQGEQLCKLYSDLWNVSSICLRYFNVYGPREPLRGIYAPVIGLFKKQKENGLAMTIVGDGKQKRDFTYVKDVVKANFLAAGVKGITYEIFNVGYGKNYSINQIADLIGGEKKYIPKRVGEARETLADNTRIKEILGWNPKYSLEEMIFSY